MPRRKKAVLRSAWERYPVSFDDECLRDSFFALLNGHIEFVRITWLIKEVHHGNRT